MLEIKKLNKSKMKLVFTGDLSISEIGEIYDKMKGIDLECDTYDVLVKEVEMTDLSFFQVLLAFIKELKDRKKVVKLDMQLGDEFDRIYKRAGIEGELKKN